MTYYSILTNCHPYTSVCLCMDNVHAIAYSAWIDTITDGNQFV